MERRNWIILAVAIVIGLLAVIIANAYFSGVEQQHQRIAANQKMVRIVVATQPLEFGTKLNEQNVRLQAWPANSVPEGAFATIPAVLKDRRVALRPIVVGEPVLASKVSGTDGRATLAAILPEGMRATSIHIDAVKGVSGFVLPGTMVDVLLTRQIAGEGSTNQDMRSDVVLENVQVLAIDQTASEKQDKPKVAKTATLAVTLLDAQRLAIAEKLGTLSLVLRKVEDAGTEGEGVMARTITDRQLGLPRIRIAGRSGGGGGPSGYAPPSPSRSAPSVAMGYSGHSGPMMVVVRGTEPTSYPVSRLGGR